ncbi:putative glycoside hydrolase [Paenibacillus lutrae]|uniref:GTP-binding protein n=1 Tax=Paenibacillus lutrae TaxID=2078573 RepID=A0A7X3FF23_9BACL|nr:putative glycoside hydrolase [Paenibacillus lutrae]MVO98513.1 GTP-binding protein [Paenibacillus lutrae]
MNVILAAMMLLWGSLSGTGPDPALESLAKAVVTNTKSTAATSGTDKPDGGLAPVNKKDPQPDAPKVKGIYLTAHSAGGSKLDSLLQLLDETELNSMVIDVKDDWGQVTYDTGNAELAAKGTTKKLIRDMPALMEKLKQHDVYPIARIVVFKDTMLANNKPELSFLNPNGTVWTNGKKTPESFVNPYKKEVWDYNIAVAKEAAKAGFKEIQFDYVRFPEGFEKRADTLKYDKDDRTRIQAVSEFVQYAHEQLTPLGVRISVDIFGYAVSVPAAEGIGQDFQAISQNVDVISPMIYPSHYTNGWYGVAVPDANPYATISGAMKDTNKKLLPLIEQKTAPVVRPWIQDFTASWVQGHIRYGAKQMQDQYRALKENGTEEFLLWNAANNYTRGVDYK